MDLKKSLVAAIAATSIAYGANAQSENISVSKDGDFRLGFVQNGQFKSLEEALPGYKDNNFNVLEDSTLPTRITIDDKEFNSKYADLTEDGIKNGWFGFSYANFKDEDVVKALGKAAGAGEMVIYDVKNNNYITPSFDHEIRLGKNLSHNLYKYVDDMPKASALYSVVEPISFGISKTESSSGGGGSSASGASGGSSGGSGGSGDGGDD